MKSPKLTNPWPRPRNIAPSIPWIVVLKTSNIYTAACATDE